MQGILFKPDMIKAIVEDRKTVTRRVIKIDHLGWLKCDDAPFCFVHKNSGEHHIFKPRYHIGEIVYIKEAFTYITLAEKDPWKDKAIKDGSFRRMPDGSPVTVWYKLDGYEIGASWETPLFMPAWAARYFLQITGNRPERLLPLNDEEAIKEGIVIMGRPELNELSRGKFTHAYLELWDSINPAYPFSSNPWCFRYEFRRVERPA